MRTKFIAAMVLAATAITATLAQEPAGDTADRPAGGWMGLTGAKDPGDPKTALEGWTPVDLKIVPAEKEIPFRTPEDTKHEWTNAGPWIDVSSGTLPLTGMKGGPIKFKMSANKIVVDLDGDGNEETPFKGEFLSAKVKRADGGEGVHHFRLRRDGDRYVYNRACFATGKFDGTPLALVDENNDGNYGDVYGDAIRVGNAPMAQRFPHLVTVKGKLYHVIVDKAATKAWLKLFDGPTGKIDLVTKYQAKSKPVFLTLKQGEAVIDAAAKEMTIPVGTWALADCVVGATYNQCVKIGVGRMNPIAVTADQTTTLPWGMPGIIEFTCSKDAGQLKVDSGSVKGYGQGGEEYVKWRGTSFYPRLEAVDEATRKLVFQCNAIDAYSTVRVPSDKPYVVRLQHDVPYLGRFESAWQ